MSNPNFPTELSEENLLDHGNEERATHYAVLYDRMPGVFISRIQVPDPEETTELPVEEIEN